MVGGSVPDDPGEFASGASGTDDDGGRLDFGRVLSMTASRSRGGRRPRPGPLQPGSFPSVLWALVPAMTFSLGAPFSFAFAAARLRSRGLAGCAALYGVLVGSSLWLLQGVPLSWQFNLGYALALSVVTAGTAHAFVIRSKVFPEPSAHDLHLAAAKERIQARDRSRKLLAADPTLAAELGIGRPDLPGRYDDGGLVDVNHVPVGVLSRLPGFDDAMAERIGTVREDVGGFTSLEDLSVTLGIPPHVLDQASDHLVFVR